VLRAEQQWWASEGRAAAAAVANAPAAEVAATLARLGGHPLLGREVGPYLRPLLERREPQVVVLACASVGRLRARCAADDLRRLRGAHADPAVRTAAGAALRALAPELPAPRDELP
jgi:hypothetical protein